LAKTRSVLGAPSESEVRSRIEWSFTWPVNLWVVS
jgi:hypothetical protein